MTRMESCLRKAARLWPELVALGDDNGTFFEYRVGDNWVTLADYFQNFECDPTVESLWRIAGARGVWIEPWRMTDPDDTGGPLYAAGVYPFGCGGYPAEIEVKSFPDPATAVREGFMAWIESVEEGE